MSAKILDAELKPCPFCASEAVIIATPTEDIEGNKVVKKYNTYTIECTRPGCMSLHGGKSVKNAIAKWNTRKGGSDE